MNIGNGLELFEQFQQSHPNAVSAIAESLGIDVSEITPQILATQFIAHELGHIVDYEANAPTLEEKRERRKRDLDTLPIPGHSGPMIRGEFGQRVYQTNVDYFARRGIGSFEEMVAAYDAAYRKMDSERIPDEFAAQVIDSLDLIN